MGIVRSAKTIESLLKKAANKGYDYQACEDIFKTINREIDSITFRTDILNKNKF